VSDSDHPKGYADLKALAEKMRRRLATMYAMSAGNDPWMVQQDFRSKPAHWFADLYKQLNISAGIHVRRIFYLLVSQPNLIRLNGERFENTVECSNYLGDAVRDARYLGLVPVNAFIDLKNPEPTINLNDGGDAAAEVGVNDGEIEQKAFGEHYKPPKLKLPETWFEEPKIGQRYHLEIWIEKSTANDVLLPLGRKYGINVCTFTGEASLTACKNLVNRAIASGKPVRIFHITDFDPAGRISMSVAAARKIEFFAVQSGIDLDVRFEHVALTEEQCTEYGLPRTPIKESEHRAANFEALHGKGGTELDALEALHPGVLRDILVEHIERYYDPDLRANVETAVQEFTDKLNDADQAIENRFKAEIADFDLRRNAIAAAFEEKTGKAKEKHDRIVALAKARFDRALEGCECEITEMEQKLVLHGQRLLSDMNAALEEEAPDPDDFDWPEPAEADEWEDDPLYDSTRDYVAQVDRFRAHQGKDCNVRLFRDQPLTRDCTECKKPFQSTNPNQTACGTVCANKRAYRVRVERSRHTKNSMSILPEAR